VFAKFPVEPIRTLADYRRALIKRLVVVAMQVRLKKKKRTCMRGDAGAAE
jgi:hypothetical protein